MLRVVLLVLYLIAAYSSAFSQIGGGLDPDGLNAQVPGDIGGGWDPNG